jgi:hypothetical protein
MRQARFLYASASFSVRQAAAMNIYRPIYEPGAASAVQFIACPRCSGRITFARSSTPRIDECGFESYNLECKLCGARLAGLIDPADDALLLTAMPLRVIPLT